MVTETEGGGGVEAGTVYAIDPSEVEVPEDRWRKTFGRAELAWLTRSIEKRGQYQAAVCTMEDGKVLLIAGERRLRACKELKRPFEYVLKEEVTDPLLRRIIELEENTKREKLPWKDLVLAVEEMHRLKQEYYGDTSPGARGGHRVKDTAMDFGRSEGATTEDIELAKFAKEIPEVAAAKTKGEAKKIVARIKDEIGRGVALERAREKVDDAEKDTHINGTEGPGAESMSLRSPLESMIEEFDKRISLGRMEEEVPRLGGGFSVVVFDPPWGVGLDKVRKKGGGTKDYVDTPENFDKNLESWLAIIYKSMHDASHLYLFFPIVKHDFVYSTLEGAGFEVNRIPIYWWKRGAHVVRSPKVWPGMAVEPIAYARKGSKDLVQQGRPNLIDTPMPTSRIKKEHPSAKHPEVMKELLQRSCLPGERVLDPMCGSGMMGVAAEHLKRSHELDWKMVEVDEGFRDLSLANLIKGYGRIVGETGGEEELEPRRQPWEDYAEMEVGELPEDFKGLEPGTLDWKRYWKANIDKQDEMLEWVASGKGRK